MHPFHWIKEHPVTVALGVGALLLIYVVMRAGSGGSADSGQMVAYNPGPSDAAVAAGAQVQLGQLALQGQTQQIQGQLAATQIAGNVQIHGTDVAGAVANYQTEQQANVSLAGIEATKEVNLAGQTTQQTIALANAARDVTIQQLSADVTKTGYQEQTKQLGIVTQGYTDITRSNNDTQASIVRSTNEANVAINQQNANAYVATAVPLAQVQQKEQEVASYYQYKSGSRGGGILGAIGGVIAGLF